MYNRARGPIVGTVSVNTSAAEAALNRVLNLMNAVNRRGNVPAGPGVLPGESGRTQAPGRTPVSPRPGRRSQPVVIQVGERELAGVMHDYIGSDNDLADERRRAGGSR
jgi:hypothetical protein